MGNLYVLYVFILFTFILNVVNFFYTYRRLTKREIILYIYLLISILGWFLSNAGADLIKDPTIAVLFARLGILFPLNTFNAVFQITRIFPQSLYKRFSDRVFFLFNLITLFVTLVALYLLNTAYNIVSIEIVRDGPIFYEPGALYFWIAALSFLLFVPAIVVSWTSGLQSYTRIQKRQVFVLLVTYIVVACSMVLGLVLFPLQGLSQYAPTMFLSLSLLLFVVNQNFLIKGFMPNVFYDLGLLVWGIFASGVTTLFIFQTTQYQGDLTFFSFFLLTLMLLLLLLWSYHRVISLLRKEYYGIEEEVLKFASKTTIILDREKIIQELRHTLGIIFPKADSKVILEKENGEGLYLKLKKWWSSFSNPIIATQEILIEQFLLKRVDEELTKELYSDFHRKNIELAIPLNIGDKLGGAIFMENLGRVLGIKEHEILTLLAENASVAISRAILYEEVEKFSQSLQIKVDEQTKELRARMESMEQMRQREKDLLDIMGHELRTPLTIARNSLDLMEIYKKKQKKKRKTIKWNSDFQKQYEYIRSAIRREMGIVETLLSATKLDAKKMETHIADVDLTRIVETTLLGFEQEALRKGLKVKVDMDMRKSWVIKADSLQIQQVLDNLVSNAIKYTHEGTVRISLKEEGKKVKIVVSDTGEGISEKDLKKLGTKFFRLNQYLPSNDKDDSKEGLVRPGGTGLGLYVAFGLIDLMNGSYDVKSKEDKGSTFTVTFEKADES